MSRGWPNQWRLTPNRSVEVVDTSRHAESMFNKFHDKKHRKHTELPFTWPEKIQEVGEGRSVMYRSNKWKLDPEEYEDYKHLAESPNMVYAEPGFLREWSDPRRRIGVSGPMVNLQSPMPRHVAVLASLLGVQVKIGSDYYEVTVPHGMLAGGEHPKTNEKFLVIYTKNGGVHMIITGKELDVERDGIVG